MKIENILSKKQTVILNKWRDVIMATYGEAYSTDTSSFLKKQKNQFANPVGHTISEGTEAVIDALINGISWGNSNDKATAFLDKIVKIRAVQDFSPSQAIGFIFALKKVIREAIKDELEENSIYNELLILESRIDDLAISSFESYMKHREKIYELKVKEFKSMAFRLLERANLVTDIDECDAISKNNDTNLDNMK